MLEDLANLLDERSADRDASHEELGRLADPA
jgi:hypothetical protein